MIMIGKYILDANGEPIPERDLLVWGRWLQQDLPCRHVAGHRVGDCHISTVFLGLDHNFLGNGAPVLWETMVFGGPLDQEMDRCAGSREQALAMHARMLQKVRDAVESVPTK